MEIIKELDCSSIHKQYLVNSKGQKKILQIFSIQSLQSYNLQKTIEYNQYIMTGVQYFGMVFPEAFLPTLTEMKEKQWLFLKDQYVTTLDKYLLKNSHSIKEEQAIKIFSQILQSIYSLYKGNFVHRNLRLEHFVLHNGRWKLRSLVFTNQNNGIKSQYTFNPLYQAPQEYVIDSDDDLDLCLILTWNLGSILLDILCGVHFLNSSKIVNKFKNKQFTLKSVGSHLNFSPKIQKYLGQMLHFNPEQRMKLQTLFQDPFFSKTVSEHYKYNKSKLNDSKMSMQKTVILQKMQIKNSLNMSYRNSKELNIFTSNNILKIDHELTKSHLRNSRKYSVQEQDSQQIMDEDDYFQNLKLVTNVQKKKQTYLQQQPSSENDPQFKNILSIYKTMTDRSLLLVISADKISQIPYKHMFKEEFILLTKFSVYYASLIELNKMIRMMNLNKNIFQVEEDIFENFISTDLFNTYRTEINETYVYRHAIFEQLGLKLEKLPSESKNFLKQPSISQYIQDRNPKQRAFDDIKKPYRIILKKAYDIISVLYNDTENEQYCRLSLYTMFCLTIDKLYIRENIEFNFEQFLKWNTKNSTHELIVGSEKFVYISVSQLQRYIDTAPIKTLIAHSKRIFVKYFKI